MITGMYCTCQCVAIKWQMMLTLYGCCVCVCIHVMCQVIKLLTWRCRRRIVCSCTSLSLTRLLQWSLSVCVLLFVCASVFSVCMCVGSAAIFHSLQGPIRTCRTLCCVCGLVTLCGCVCICIYGCLCACVCTSRSIYSLSSLRVCVVRWKVTDTHTHTTPYTHSLFDKLDLELQEFAVY